MPDGALFTALVILGAIGVAVVYLHKMGQAVEWFHAKAIAAKPGLRTASIERPVLSLIAFLLVRAVIGAVLGVAVWVLVARERRQTESNVPSAQFAEPASTGRTPNPPS